MIKKSSTLTLLNHARSNTLSSSSNPKVYPNLILVTSKHLFFRDKRISTNISSKRVQTTAFNTDPNHWQFLVSMQAWKRGWISYFCHPIREKNFSKKTFKNGKRENTDQKWGIKESREILSYTYTKLFEDTFPTIIISILFQGPCACSSKVHRMKKTQK